MLIPAFRENVFVDRNLTFYNNITNRTYPIEYTLKNGKLHLDELGLPIHITPLQAYTWFVLGLTLSHVSVNAEDRNFSNLDPNNLTLNGKSCKTLVEFREQNTNSFTPQELRLKTLLFSKKFAKLFRSIIDPVDFKKKIVLITPEACIPYQDSFYLSDFLIICKNGKGIDNINLSIELDGNQHLNADSLIYDFNKDLYLKDTFGVYTLRLLNSDFDRLSDDAFYLKVQEALKHSKCNSNFKVEENLDIIISSELLNSILFDDLINYLKSTSTCKFAMIKVYNTSIKITKFSSGDTEKYKRLSSENLTKNTKLKLNTVYFFNHLIFPN